MAVLIHLLKKRKIDVKVCVTAQHREMLDQALDFFDIVPDYDLDLMKPNQSLNGLSSVILGAVDKIIDDFKPDVALVHGDTTTTFITSLASYHKGVKVAHIEAGLRTYNKRAPFPEEMNRQLTARIADFHFAPTQAAKNNLLREGVNDIDIIETGNTVVDSLLWAREKLKTFKPAQLTELKSSLSEDKKLILVTGHRRENFEAGLEKICNALKTLAQNENVEIVFPVHLNPRVSKIVEKELNDIRNVHLIAPVSYPVMVWLMDRCDLIISDSGGIQEEAPTFKKPVLVTRDVSERKEGVMAGFSFIVGTNEKEIIKKSLELINNPLDFKDKNNPYGDGKASMRILDHLLKNEKKIRQ